MMKVQQDCLSHASLATTSETSPLNNMQESPSDENEVSLETNLDGKLQIASADESDDDAPRNRRRRIHKFSDSDSDGASNEKVETEIHKVSEITSDFPVSRSRLQTSRIRRASSSSRDSSNTTPAVNLNLEAQKTQSDSDSDSDTTIFKSNHTKSYGQRSKNSSGSDTSNSDKAVKNEEQQARLKNKRLKLKDKFKSLISSRGKDHKDVEKESQQFNHSSDLEGSNDESSIENIKKIIKEGIYKSSICDPDTSDEETTQQMITSKQAVRKQKNNRRSTILTSPKPQRMSAKQAMENMQKIKSESNRMLREKDVSLPYHKPKALSLKDIMSRRKVAVSSDGKTLPIKMNGEQLKQYAQMLEERQKQMMELLQSDSDEEENNEIKSDDELLKSTAQPEIEKLSSENVDPPKETDLAIKDTTEEPNVLAKLNDDLFDVVSQSIAGESDRAIKVAISTNTEEELTKEQDSETSMKLVCTDSETSISDDKLHDTIKEVDAVSILLPEYHDAATHFSNTVKTGQNSESKNTELDSQLISLHYDSEKIDTLEDQQVSDISGEKTYDNNEQRRENEEPMDVDDFSDDDMNMEDIDNIIENAEVIRDIEDKANSQVLINMPLKAKPMLTGGPGMVIDLDDTKTLPKKSGVELLKDRFTFFAKLKTSEELEREKEKIIKPGTQHLKLKQALEEQMAEQRSLEWAKRIEDEKQQHKDIKELQGEDSDDENDIDKIEAKLEEDYEKDLEQSESEEELVENDIEIKDKPRVKSSMLADEAEESDSDDNKIKNADENEEETEPNDGERESDVDGDEREDDESSDDSESSESDEEKPSNTKKGRILKAFEDSDDENSTDNNQVQTNGDVETKSDGRSDILGSQPNSQDDILTLAQRHKSVSEDLFASQGSTLPTSQCDKFTAASECLENNDVYLGTQTFSILDSSKNTTIEGSDKLDVICANNPCDDNLEAVAATDSCSFSQSLIQIPTTQISQSQPIGEDILELCTGKFYDNEFVSQVENNSQMPLGDSQEFDSDNESHTIEHTIETQASLDVNDENTTIPVTGKDSEMVLIELNVNPKPLEIRETNSKTIVDDNLKSILDELDDPEFDTPKPNQFFCGAKTQDTAGNLQKGKVVIESQIKKKFIIESDDESNDAKTEINKRRKMKKKKPEKRALQISDDEEELSEQDALEEYESDIEEDAADRVVEYDSEENEIDVQPQQKAPKKRGKGTEFFEQEAELTSEDEWAGSGDEDEAGLDRMEREAGDEDTFHQGRLRRELGQIHMRDVLDQDKREVRIIQELLFEDGDLGGGGRQRKFKWREIEGDEDGGTLPPELRDTQEEENESEEQWRKQRHERETFLRQMQNKDDFDNSLNVLSSTTIIKANLSSKSVSMILEENNSKFKTDTPIEKTMRDITSPKKPFSLLQQSYQGSILNRGRGALARLAALAAPLAVDNDAPKAGSLAPSSKRNFVFAALTPEQPKVIKRKAEANPSTPKLMKMMKTEENQNIYKSSLLDHIWQ